MGIPVLILFIRTSVVSKFVPNTDFLEGQNATRVLCRRATCTLQKTHVCFTEERRVLCRRATCTLQKSSHSVHFVLKLTES